MAEGPARLWTVPEVAEHLRLGVSTVYQLVREGRLPASRVGGSIRFVRAEVEDFLVANRVAVDDGAPGAMGRADNDDGQEVDERPGLRRRRRLLGQRSRAVRSGAASKLASGTWLCDRVASRLRIPVAVLGELCEVRRPCSGRVFAFQGEAHSEGRRDAPTHTRQKALQTAYLCGLAAVDIESMSASTIRQSVFVWAGRVGGGCVAASWR